MGNVIVHAFNWTFADITSAAHEIKELGYAGVLISPPTFSEGREWYNRYQPLDYRIIHSPLGNLASFRRMIDHLKQYDLKLYVDIVFNHMAYRPGNDLTFPGDTILGRYRQDRSLAGNRIFGDLSRNLFFKEDFNPQSCIDAADYDDPHKISDVHNDRICDERVPEGLPDLSHNSPRVIEAQRQYLSVLKDMGVDGYRIDAAKHMPVEHIQKVFIPEITGGMYVFGEIIPAAHGQFLGDFLAHLNFSAYDFKLFYALRAALGDQGSFEQLEDPEDLDTFRSLTFAITHDIPNNEAMREFILDVDDRSRTDENLAYAYILCRDGGVPLVYSDKGQAEGLYTDNWNNAYKKKALTRMLSFHNTLFGRKMDIISAGRCHVIISREGLGIAALNKCAEEVTIDITTDNLKGTFRNLSGQGSITIDDDLFPFTIPPRSCQLYLRESDAPT